MPKTPNPTNTTTVGGQVVSPPAKTKPKPPKEIDASPDIPQPPPQDDPENTLQAK